MVRLRLLRALFASFAVLVVLGCLGACGDGDGGAVARSLPTGTVSRVEIRETGALLTRPGETRGLSAAAFDANGTEIEARIAWTSSKPEAVRVDASGTVTAVVGNGAAQVVAEAAGVRSAPLLVVVTAPPPGTILVTDAQIAGEPTETNPSAAPSFDNTYDVVLRDVAAPPVGAIVLNTESKIVGGRVIAVTPAPAGSGGQHSVRLGLLSSRELFPSLTLNEVFDLTQAPVTIAPEVEADYELQRSGDVITFVKRAVPRGSMRVRAGTRALPPFTSCEAIVTGLGENAPLPIGLSAPPLFSVKINPTLDVAFSRERGLERFVVAAEPIVKVEGGITVTAAFEGKIECTIDLFTIRIPVGGPLALVIGGLVPVGVGIETSGKLTLATFGATTKVEAKTKAQFGFACSNGGSCELVKSLGDLTVTATPTIDTPSLGDRRVDVGLAAFGQVKAAVGNPFLKSLRFEAVKVKAGGKIGGSFASQASQIADPLYASDYKLSLEAKAGVGADLSGVLKLLGLLNVAAVELVITKDLAKSPGAALTGATTTSISRAATSDATDPTRFQTGDTVNATIKLNPETVTFLTLYNVKDIVLVRKTVGEVKEVARTSASDGATEASLSFVAPDAGSVRELTAFVTTRLLPLDILSLELAPISGDSKGLQVAASSGFACASLPTGAVKCWGGNAGGQLGNATNDESSVAVSVNGITTAKGIATGTQHACAVLADGSVRCWGSNGSGELGNGLTTASNVPVVANGVSGATAVSAGSSYTCAVVTGGAVSCWGGSNSDSSGVLGNGTNSGSLTPVGVSGLTGVTALASGTSHSCAVVAGGTVKCWGLNGAGKCGVAASGPNDCDGNACAQTPVVVDGLTNVVGIAVGSAHSCALLGDGTVKCWGQNSSGQLGSGGLPSSSFSPVLVSGITTAVAIGAGSTHTCAALADGTAMCWGAAAGGLGNASSFSTTPVAVTSLTGASGIAGGSGFSCAALGAGTLACWGLNDQGQCGNATKVTAPAPVAVVGVP